MLQTAPPLSFKFNKNHSRTDGRFISGTSGNAGFADLGASPDAAWKDEWAGWAKKANPADLDNLRNYGGGAYKGMNQDLRAGISSWSGSRQNRQDNLTSMDSLLKTTTISRNVRVYRGTHFTPAEAGALKVGATFKDKAFVSTSTSRNVAKKWSRGAVVMEIDVPKGKRGIYMPAVQKEARFKQEHELLLPRGSSFRIKNIRNPNGLNPVIEVEML